MTANAVCLGVWKEALWLAKIVVIEHQQGQDIYMQATNGKFRYSKDSAALRSLVSIGQMSALLPSQQLVKHDEQARFSAIAHRPVNGARTVNANRVSYAPYRGDVTVLTSWNAETPKKSDEEEQDEASWQTIFWALFALALNSMTQPSILDIEIKASNLLFPAHSSPIVCLSMLWMSCWNSTCI